MKKLDQIILYYYSYLKFEFLSYNNEIEEFLICSIALSDEDWVIYLYDHQIKIKYNLKRNIKYSFYFM
jgi:hypothetical protein